MLLASIITAINYFFPKDGFIMSCRYANLVRTLAGYQETGIPLVQSDGIQLQPAANLDDIGIYILIPKLAAIFGLSITQAIELFFNGLSALSFVIGLIGCYKLFPTWLQRIIAFIALVFIVWRTSFSLDVYRISAILAIAIIPWTLYFMRNRASVATQSWYGFLFLSGGAIGTGHYLRAHAGVGTLLFVVTLILSYWPLGKKAKVYALATLMSGMLLSSAYFNYAWHQYENFIIQQLPHHTQTPVAHPFWHNVYIGFGFLNNNLGIKYDDSISAAHGAKHGYHIVGSPEYEQFLCNEIINLIKNHRYFVAITLGAKLGLLLILFLFYANIGLFADWLTPIAWQVRLAFFLSICWNALPGFLVMPSIPDYLYGFLACTVLYSMVTVNHWISKRSCITN